MLTGQPADVVMAKNGAFADRIDAGNVGLGVLRKFVVTFDFAGHALYLARAAGCKRAYCRPGDPGVASAHDSGLAILTWPSPRERATRSADPGAQVVRRARQRAGRDAWCGRRARRSARLDRVVLHAARLLAVQVVARRCGTGSGDDPDLVRAGAGERGAAADAPCRGRTPAARRRAPDVER